VVAVDSWTSRRGAFEASLPTLEGHCSIGFQLVSGHITGAMHI
jgi:hypothetical protein